MNDHNRIDGLLQSALSRHRIPSFLSVQERALRVPCEDRPSANGRAMVLRRLAFSCCSLVLIAWSVGVLGSLWSPGLSAQEDGHPETVSSSAVFTEDFVEHSHSYAGGVSSAGAILYNILPTNDVPPSGSDAPQRDPGTASGGYGAGTGASSNVTTRSFDLQKSSYVGTALRRAIEKDPGKVYDVVADLESADFSSEAVADLKNRFLLYLDTNSYYLQMDLEQVERYAQSNIKLMLVGTGSPVRPAGYPDAFDVGSAWIYNTSPEGTQLSVLLTSPLPAKESPGAYTAGSASEYLNGRLPDLGIRVPDSSAINLKERNNVTYAVYALPLDRQSALAVAYNGVATDIQAIPSARSVNPREQEYYYMVNGDGWAFSN